MHSYLRKLELKLIRPLPFIILPDDFPLADLNEGKLNQLAGILEAIDSE